MRIFLAAALSGLLLSGLVPAAARAESPVKTGPVKIGMITTLSGPGAVIGNDVRDGFALALKERGGELVGRPVELVVGDDGQKPDVAVQLTSRMLQRDGVQLFTGVVFSNVALAIMPAIERGGAVMISPNAGPTQFAGEKCSASFFVVSSHNDLQFEAAGAHLARLGVGKVVTMAPNYPAGRDGIKGFRRFYDPSGGAVVSEIYTAFGQLDYAAEITQIRALKPDAVFYFYPGGMGINFAKQWAQSGAGTQIRLFGSGYSLSQELLPAIGADALGLPATAFWSPDLDTPVNRRFVAGFRQGYGRLPSAYAAQAYDTAIVMEAAAELAGGFEPAAFRAALPNVAPDTTRGTFRFNRNHFPIQDAYLVKVVEKDGVLTTQVEERIFRDHKDPDAAACKL